MLADYGRRSGILRQPKIKGGSIKPRARSLHSQVGPDFLNKVTITKTLNDSLRLFLAKRAEGV